MTPTNPPSDSHREYPDPSQDPSYKVKHDLLKLNQIRQVYSTTSHQWQDEVDPKVQLSVDEFCTLAALSEVFPDLATAEMATTLHQSIMGDAECAEGRLKGTLMSGIERDDMSFNTLSDVCKHRFGSALQVKRKRTIKPFGLVAKDSWRCSDPTLLRVRMKMLSEEIVSSGEVAPSLPGSGVEEPHRLLHTCRLRTQTLSGAAERLDRADLRAILLLVPVPSMRKEGRPCISYLLSDLVPCLEQKSNGMSVCTVS